MRSEGKRPLRVLAADDSAVMRGVLRTMFQLHAAEEQRTLPAMELCAVVRNGVECLEAVGRMRPDAILLDLEMPVLDGLGVLRRLREMAPEIPVIMCSAYTERGARSTLDALALGAKDYVMKPGSQSDFAAALDLLMQQVLPKIAALTAGTANASVPLQVSTFRAAAGARVELVTVGVSTGGPSALEQMLPRLPADFAVPVMIVQHMPKLFTGALAERLDRLCAVKVREAFDGAVLEPGTVWLAPGDEHMEVARMAGGAGGVRLHRRAPLNSCMPSVDYLFSSAAKAYGAGTLALVLTGMGSDGLDGAMEIKRAGGSVYAQDQASSAVWGMPGRIVEAGLAVAQVPLSGIASVLLDRVQAGRDVAVRNKSSKVEHRLEVNYGLL